MIATHLGLRWMLRRRSAWLALAAVVLTVMVSIAVMGVVQGFVEVMAKQVRANESDLTMVPSFFDPGLEDSTGYRAFVSSEPYVAALAPSISGYCMVTPKRDDSGRDFRDTFPALFDAIEWDADLALGRLPTPSLHRAPTLDLTLPPLEPTNRGSGFLTPSWRERLALAGGTIMPGMGLLPLPPSSWPIPGVILGQELAYINGLLPGSALHEGTRLHLTVPNGRGGLVGKIEVEVSDTLGTGIYEVDRLNCLIPLPYGKRLAGLRTRANEPDLVTAYRINIPADQNLREAAALLHRHTGNEVQTWQQRRSHLVKGAEQQRNILGFVMILVQLLAVFIVYASFSTLVTEKRRDIGVLFGIGVQRGPVLRAFLFAALMCCLGGGLLGWGLGWGILASLNWFSQTTGIILFPQEFFYSPDTPISFDPRVPMVYIGTMTVIGLIAALIPAWRASRVDPVDIFREGA